MPRHSIVLCLLLAVGHFTFAQAPDSLAARQALLQAIEQFDEHESNRDALPSRARYELRDQQAEALLDKLAGIPRALLSTSDQINYDLLVFILEDRRATHAFGLHLIPFNAEGGFYNGLAYLPNRFRFESASDFERYHKALRRFPEEVRANLALLREGVERGVVSSRLVANKYFELTAPFKQAVDSEHPLLRVYEGLPEEWPEQRRETERLIRDSIQPLFTELDQFMQATYLPAATEAIGLSALPGGKAMYEQRIRYYTTLDIDPDSVFAIGQAEVARLRAEMEAIIQEVEFEGSYADFLDFLRTDPRFYAKTAEEILKEASYLAKRIDGLLPAFFGKLPRLSYGVEPVPAAIAPTYTSGRYSPGSLDPPFRAGHYWVNTTKLDSRPLYALPALTLHEAVPGHHLQIALAQELEDLPTFRRRTYLSAFGEGWGLYAEYLGGEMGVYQTPYDRFGQLTYEMWRACRLVVDVGMHYKGWSRDRAVAFLQSNTALSIHECNTEIDRYIGWPGQAVSYKMGELTIRRLRTEAEAALGAAFDLRAFHDAILENGSVPMFSLEARIARLIEEGQ